MTKYVNACWKNSLMSRVFQSHFITSFTCGIIYKFLFFRKTEIKISFTRACQRLRHSNGCYRRMSASNIFCRANKSEQWQSTKCKKVLHSVIRQKFNDLCFFYTLVRSSFLRSRKSYAWWHSKCHLKRKKYVIRMLTKVKRCEQRRGFMILNDVVTRVFTRSYSHRHRQNKIKIHRSFDRNVIHSF